MGVRTVLKSAFLLELRQKYPEELLRRWRRLRSSRVGFSKLSKPAFISPLSGNHISPAMNECMLSTYAVSCFPSRRHATAVGNEQEQREGLAAPPSTPPSGAPLVDDRATPTLSCHAHPESRSYLTHNTSHTTVYG
ncbi:hypothetical protein V3C99_012918 [Haemonchus contortus]